MDIFTNIGKLFLEVILKIVLSSAAQIKFERKKNPKIHNPNGLKVLGKISKNLSGI